MLAVVIGKFKLPRIPEAEGGQRRLGVHDSVWQHPNLVMGAIGIFTYVGAEVAIGSFLVNYLNLPNIGNLGSKSAAQVSRVLLGRRDGRPLHRLGGAAESFDPAGARVQRRRCGACWCASPC